jgi:hypothetical protein
VCPNLNWLSRYLTADLRGFPQYLHINIGTRSLPSETIPSNNSLSSSHFISCYEKSEFEAVSWRVNVTICHVTLTVHFSINPPVCHRNLRTSYCVQDHGPYNNPTGSTPGLETVPRFQLHKPDTETASVTSVRSRKLRYNEHNRHTWSQNRLSAYAQHILQQGHGYGPVQEVVSLTF